MADIISVTLKRATVNGISIKKKIAKIVIEAPIDDDSSNMTVGDQAEMTSGSFMGTVTIKGRALQVALIPPTERGPGEKE
jgi:hypothetical protein